jgi:hypothetical protein
MDTVIFINTFIKKNPQYHESLYLRLCKMIDNQEIMKNIEKDLRELSVLDAKLYKLRGLATHRIKAFHDIAF